ncbi:Pentatricopeptide repeat [Heracleum sosnowskyi]|uniref:Pentatricopeptide repeat n=1 Tax=Heracleum sosnowskyi TaxID=360622 RepID=A0AAD8J2K4_9APIA|nr:Pentatricopeptide repeat [Heracleum sosnowskyi]
MSRFICFELEFQEFTLARSVFLCGLCLVYPIMSISNRGLFLDEFIRCFLSSFAAQRLQLSDEDENGQLSYAWLNSDVKGYASRGQIVNAIESLNMLRMFPGRPTVHEYNQLISCYLESKNVVSGMLMELYNVMKVSGPCPNFLTYEILLNGMASFGSSGDGVFMVEEMCRRGYRPLFRSLSGLLEKSLDLGSLRDSLAVLNLMLRFNYYPMPFTAKRLIVSLCGSGMFREAHFLFSLLLEKNHKYFQGACNYSHNQILWALCKCGQLSNALAFFGSLEKKGVVHNESSYTALIYGLCGARLWEDTYRCLDLMEIVGRKPNVKTYTIVVKFLCDVGKIKEALRLLNKMIEEGCFPDLVTFNILLRELCHQDMLGMMHALLEHINQKGFSPNQFTYASLAGGLLRRGYVPLVKNLLQVSMSTESVTDTAIYNIYLNTLCFEHKTEEALSLVNSSSGGFTPNNISYNIILKGICEEKSIGECLKFFDHIRRNGNNPDLVSYNTMLSSACKERNTSIIKRLLYQMDYEGFELNISGATSLLLYYCDDRKFSECLKLLESMMTNGPNRNILTFNALIRRLCKMQALSLAHRIFNYLKSFGLSPDTTTYIILIHAYKKVGNQMMVSQLLSDMFSQKLMFLHIVSAQNSSSLVILLNYTLHGRILMPVQICSTSVPGMSFDNLTMIVRNLGSFQVHQPSALPVGGNDFENSFRLEEIFTIYLGTIDDERSSENYFKIWSRGVKKCFCDTFDLLTLNGFVFNNVTFLLPSNHKTLLTHIDHSWMAQETVAGSTETRARIVVALFVFCDTVPKILFERKW